MKVKSKQSNRFLIKDEWYEVKNIYIETAVVAHSKVKMAKVRVKVKMAKTDSYDLVNHTDKLWATSWYHKTNFYTLQELREEKINILLKDNLF